MMPCKEIKMCCIHYDVSLYYCIYMVESHDLYKIEAYNTPIKLIGYGLKSN